MAENLLQRLFRVSTANRVWASDITYIPTAEGWVCLCVVLDRYSRRVVGWSMGQSLGVELAVQAFLMSVMHRRPPRDLLLHCDRGVQCCAEAFRRHLRRHRIRQSMSRKPRCRVISARTMAWRAVRQEKEAQRHGCRKGFSMLTISSAGSRSQRETNGHLFPNADLPPPDSVPAHNAA